MFGIGTTEKREHRSRRGLRAFVTAVAVAALAVSVAAPAAASDGNGAWDDHYPSELASCQSNVRVGPVTSIWSSAGNYYGWAEQRWGNAGECWGYQWISL